MRGRNVIFRHVLVTYSTHKEKWMESLFVDTEVSSRIQVSEMLFLKFLWGEISDREFEALTLFSLENETIFWFLKELKNNKSKFLLRKRVNAHRLFSGTEPLSKRLFESVRNCFIKVDSLQWYEDRPKPEKYSGWKRHQNDQGSLRTTSLEFERQEAPGDIENNLLSIKTVLTVGVLSPSENGNSLKMAYSNAETVKYLKILKEVFKNENL